MFLYEYLVFMLIEPEYNPLFKWEERVSNQSDLQLSLIYSSAARDTNTQRVLNDL